MPTITTREYNPESGALLQNITTLDFGELTSGGHTRVKVIDVAFTDVSSVSNIKIGVISAGDMTVADRFGVENTSDFDANKASTALTSHFSGVNSDGTAGNSNNVDIGNRTDSLSNYIYLDIEGYSEEEIEITGAYKLFFDYS